ncbi:unnamed protein product [Merluccius merluccius]
MERMESMEPISAVYTTDYPEILPGETRGSAPSYNQDLMHKTILVGDSGVGKTSLLVQFDQGKFIPGSFSATVGIGFTNREVTVDNLKVKLQIWDTAGQERFRSVTHAYYRDAQALLLLYDITSKSSFDNIRAWLTEIHEYAQSDIVIMLLGNKADMAAERAIKRAEGEKLAREYCVPFMETSAKTGVNVELAFISVAKCVLNHELNMMTTVNGVSVAGMQHAEVVAVIKAGGEETSMLVVDPEAEAYFTSCNVLPTEEHLTERGSRVSMDEVNSRTAADPSPSSYGSSSNAAPPSVAPAVTIAAVPEPAGDSSLSLSLAQVKERAHQKRSAKKAPTMDWSKRNELFSNL